MIDYIWNPFLLLVTTPLFLKLLGSDNYGMWMFLNATIGIGSILLSGINPTVIKKISSSIAQKNQEQIEFTVRGGFALSIIGSVAISAVIIIVFLVFDELFLGKMAVDKISAITGITAAMVLSSDLFDGVLGATLRGAERYEQCAKVELTSRTLLNVIAIALVFVGVGVYSIFIAQIVAAFVRLYIRYFFVRRLFPTLSFKPDFKRCGAILDLARWGWLQGAGCALYSIADRFIIGAVLGASSVAHYTIASQLAIQIQAVMSAALSVVFPAVSRMISSGDSSSLVRITTLTLAASWSATGLMCFTLLHWRMDILTLWLGHDMATATENILFYLTIAALIQGLTVSSHFILLGFGKFRLVAITGFIAGLASILIMLFLVKPFGEIGVGIGRIAYGTVMFIYFLPLYRLVYNKQVY